MAAMRFTPRAPRLCWMANPVSWLRRSPFLCCLLLCVITVALPACDRVENRAVEKSLFRVLALKEYPYGDFVVRGTAFKVDAPATVVTNYHVVQDATVIVLVYWHDGRFEHAEARVEHADRTRDLALLKAERPLPGGALPLAMYTPPSGSEAWAFGFPGAADAMFGRTRGIADFLEKLSQDVSLSIPTRTFGTISGERQRNRTTYIQHQAPISQGSSGGPLVDACGSVIGINTLTTLSASSINGAVSSGELIDLMRLRALNANVVGSRCWMVLEPHYVVYTAGIIAAIVLLAAGLIAVRYVAAHGSRLGRGREPAMAGGRVSSEPANVIEITPIPLDVGPEGLRRPASASTPSSLPARAQAKLIPVTGGRSFDVPLGGLPDGVVIGRELGCTIVLDDPTISRRHCRLDLDAMGLLRIKDLNSGNGTRINGRQVASGTAKAGDRIGLGSLEFRLELRSGAAQVAEAPLNATTWQLAAIDERGNLTRFAIDGSASKRTWVLGRVGEYADLVIASPSVSGRHAMLRTSSDGSLEVQDLGSSNGTILNGKRVGTEWTPIKASSQLKLGGCEIKVTRGSYFPAQN
ncbi:MAG TPA: FHA domain-containing protein [Hyphomicrobiaceae bacterium]|jgi:pSer/pThr/pTyr-binding forkhead associated (FHA) protein|nr:FHA domain-containing protein [Hyphomicrobiaceae bacterium]